ncbi:FtsK/SpoIIIE domain-containing protein [Nonomuraea jabiensis]|uniref:S-DNA-T family DNA segregation ATPase FtsK/SpoIIIE n=1 Tax=Nonomuraea jabiensis TaxID=882448 RepID=A0A7W9G7M2_9ACTN|nr:FtsK/SpoIIIE domain-containing protein [Nonomuraea jabiensis]MBB5778659.1 S-DNA-T family DNA segregation ATPase FtsK/SpoIIIE [Nonomuraea jabiensis]
MRAALPELPVTIPVAPTMSMFDPVFIGIDEFGNPVYLDLVYHNLLDAGEPGGGKSVLIQNLVGHAFMCHDFTPVLLDPKWVELGMWMEAAEAAGGVFVGPDIDKGLRVLRRLQKVMDRRYSWLVAHGRRKFLPSDLIKVIGVFIDELAYYTATTGTPEQQKEFIALVRDLVARGRACAMPVIAATQRPSVDIIPTSLRDLFGYRAAFRCTTPNSSDIILGHGWASAGFNAQAISPSTPGVFYLIAEGGIPHLVKAAYLTDEQIHQLVDYVTWIRRNGDPAPVPLAA